MITIDVAEYCSACMDFDPDVQRPQKAYGMSEEIVISDTVIRCSNRNRCKNIERYLRKKVTNDGVGKTRETVSRVVDGKVVTMYKDELEKILYKDLYSHLGLQIGG